MGAKKSSRASSSTSNYLADQRIVAGEGAFVLGPDARYSTSSDDDLSVTDARSYSDSRDQSFRYSDSSTRTDNSNRSQNWLDFSDRSLNYADSRAYLTDASWRDNSDRSVNLLDASDRSDRSSSLWFADGSNRSVTNITGTDPGAVKVAQFGAELVRDLGLQGTDSMRTIAGFGADLFGQLGGSATDLFAMAGSNAAMSWKDTVAAAERTYGDAVARAERIQSDTIGQSMGLLGDMLDRAGRTVDASGRLAEVALLNAQPTEGKIADGAKWALIAAAAVGGFWLLNRARA